MELFLNSLKYPDQIDSNLELIKKIESPNITVKEYLKFLSAKGNSYAQYKLGCFYCNGELGFQQNYLQAKIFYELAASQNHSGSQYKLGLLYHHGYGVAQDYYKAKEYYEQAASQGHSDSQNNLGYFYDYGLGSQDYQKLRNIMSKPHPRSFWFST